MSEEIKEIVKDNDELLVTYKDNSFRTFDTSVDVIDYIINLERENKQLKEMQCTYLGTGCKRRIQQLESVLDEIREYIEKDYSFVKRGDIPLMSRAEQLAGKLLQILDKVDNGTSNE